MNKCLNCGKEIPHRPLNIGGLEENSPDLSILIRAMKDQEFKVGSFKKIFKAIGRKYCIDCVSELFGKLLSESVSVLALKSLPYHVYLKTKHWENIRKDAVKRAGGKCQICGKRAKAGSPLNVHHNNYHSVGQERAEDIVVLCIKHHEMVEREKLQHKLLIIGTNESE